MIVYCIRCLYKHGREGKKGHSWHMMAKVLQLAQPTISKTIKRDMEKDATAIARPLYTCVYALCFPNKY
jgi:hypothetical protein